MRYVLMGIITVISYVLQSSLLSYVEVYDVKPNLILIIIISYALIRGREEGAIYGLLAGLLLDMMGGKIIGLSAVLGMYTGLLVGSVKNRIYNENYVISTLMTAGATLGFNLASYMFYYAFMGREQFWWHLFGYILPEVLYNSVVSLFVYFFILYVNKKLDYKKKLSRTY